MTLENGQQNCCSSSECYGSVVSVAFPIAIPGLYDYRISPEFKGRIKTGTAVLVDLRNRQTWSCCRDQVFIPSTELKPVLRLKKTNSYYTAIVARGNSMNGSSLYQCDIAEFSGYGEQKHYEVAAKTVQVFVYPSPLTILN